MREAETAQKPLEIADKHGLRSYVRKRPRSLSPKYIAHGAKPIAVRGTRWVLPWNIDDYPGLQKGAVELFGGRYALETMRGWWKGKQVMPAAAALMLSEAIRARCEAGDRLIAELEAYALANPPKRPAVGFRAIDPETGLSGRPKVGRKRAKEV
jgi:hypothetical protein